MEWPSLRYVDGDLANTSRSAEQGKRTRPSFWRSAAASSAIKASKAAVSVTSPGVLQLSTQSLAKPPSCGTGEASSLSKEPRLLRNRPDQAADAEAHAAPG